jgi:hypothetical protein
VTGIYGPSSDQPIEVQLLDQKSTPLLFLSLMDYNNLRTNDTACFKGFVDNKILYSLQMILNQVDNMIYRYLRLNNKLVKI